MFTFFGIRLLAVKVFWFLIVFAFGAVFGAYRAKKKFVLSNEQLIRDLALAKQQLVAFEQVQQAEISHVVEKVLSKAIVPGDEVKLIS